MPRIVLRTVLATIAVLAMIAAMGGAMVVKLGLYDVAANTQHLQPVYSLLQQAMHRSVKRRAEDVQPPVLDDAGLVRRGAGCFAQHCVQCHGAPGIAPAPFAQSLQPVPGPLVDWKQTLEPRDVYWIVRNGIRMSGMPAWERQFDEGQLWAVVAFLNRLPELTAAQYAQLAGSATGAAAGSRPHLAGDRASIDDQPQAVPSVAAARPQPGDCAAAFTPPDATESTRRGDARRGVRAMKLHACGACHTVPGLVGAFPQVGPPLKGIGARGLIAGRLPNTPDNMTRWLLNPQAIDPQTTMPAMGLSESDARDIAAYLATLR